MPSLPVLTETSHVELRPLVVRPEDDEYVVGSMDSGEFIALPEIGRRALDLLGEGGSVTEAERRLAIEYEVEIDLLDLVEKLIELGFVQSVDGHLIDVGEPLRPTFRWLETRHVAWIFSRSLTGLAALVAGVAALILIREPALLPTYHKFLWLRRTSIVLAVNTLVLLAVVTLHEFAHLVAARSVGVPGRISISTRLYALAAITDVRCLWAVPRRSRFRVHLAGMTLDLLVFCLAVLVSAVFPYARPFLGAVTVIVILNVAGQFQLFMRTDVYYAVAELARAKNLYQDAAVLAVDRLRRLARREVGRADPLAGLSSRERSVVRRYAVFMVAGSAVALGMYAVYGIPIAGVALIRGIESLHRGLSGGSSADLIDGILTLGVEGGFQGLFLYAFFKGRRDRVRTLRDRIG